MILIVGAVLVFHGENTSLGTQRIIYVDDDAAGTDNGSSWDNAFRHLQDALAAARAAEKPVEIRIAQGMYRPDQLPPRDPSVPPARGGVIDIRDIRFVLADGMMLMGGYAGAATADPNARDVTLYETIISGDRNGNDEQTIDPFDLSSHPSREDNCRSLIAFGGGTKATMTLDGLVVAGATSSALEISGGNVSVSNCVFRNNAGDSGGAVYGSGTGDLKFYNCTFTGNWAEEVGGGIFVGNYSAGALMSDCIFHRNTSGRYGGAMAVGSNQMIRVTRCTFQENTAGEDGGAVDVGPLQKIQVTDCSFKDNSAGRNGGALSCVSWDADTSAITACSFSRNRAVHGGAVFWKGDSSNTTDAIDDCWFYMNSAAVSGGALECQGRDLAIANCSFLGNSTGQGGAIATNTCRTTITNTIFAGNRAWQCGGAILSRRPLTITACTFADNAAPDASALAHLGGSACENGSRLIITDCILRDGGAEISNDTATRLDVLYCDIEGGWPGVANLDADPCFAAPGYWDTNNTPDDPSDDTWIEGDYHLKSKAGRWDPAAENWVKDPVDSPCIDAGDPYSSYARELWPHGLRTNMGAYGNTAEASLSSSPSGALADLNNDAVVSLRDFARVAQQWLSPGPLTTEDLNRDGGVDCRDLQILASEWLSERVDLRLTEYWPLVRDNEWHNATVIYDGGHGIYIVDRLSINGFDIAVVRESYGGSRFGSASSHTSYYAYINGTLYSTSARANLERLPDVSSGFYVEWPEIIQIGRPFHHATEGELTPIRTTFRRLACLFGAEDSQSILTLYPAEDQDRDVLAFVNGSGRIVYAFGRDYGLMLESGMGGTFMKRPQVNP